MLQKPYLGKFWELIGFCDPNVCPTDYAVAAMARHAMRPQVPNYATERKHIIDIPEDNDTWRGTMAGAYEFMIEEGLSKVGNAIPIKTLTKFWIPTSNWVVGAAFDSVLAKCRRLPQIYKHERVYNLNPNRYKNGNAYLSIAYIVLCAIHKLGLTNEYFSFADNPASDDNFNPEHLAPVVILEDFLLPCGLIKFKYINEFIYYLAGRVRGLEFYLPKPPPMWWEVYDRRR